MNNFKEKAKQLIKEVEGYIVFNDEKIKGLLSYEIDAETTLFKSLMKKITIKLEKKGDYLDKTLKVYYGFENNYLFLGSFKIYEIEEDKENKEITLFGYDLMLNTMKEYDLNLIYPLSLIDYTKILATGCNLELFGKFGHNIFKNLNNDISNGINRIIEKDEIVLKGITNTNFFSISKKQEEFIEKGEYSVSIIKNSNNYNLYIVLVKDNSFKEILVEDKTTFVLEEDFTSFYFVGKTEVNTPIEDRLKIMLKKGEYHEYEKYNKMNDFIIKEEKYKNVLFRDIFDEIGKITKTTAMIENDKLYFKPITKRDTLTESEFINLKLGHSKGKINTLVLARTPQEDNIFREDKEMMKVSNSNNVIRLSDLNFDKNVIVEENNLTFNSYNSSWSHTFTKLNLEEGFYDLSIDASCTNLDYKNGGLVGVVIAGHDKKTFERKYWFEISWDKQEILDNERKTITFPINDEFEWRLAFYSSWGGVVENEAKFTNCSISKADNLLENYETGYLNKDGVIVLDDDYKTYKIKVETETSYQINTKKISQNACYGFFKKDGTKIHTENFRKRGIIYFRTNSETDYILLSVHNEEKNMFSLTKAKVKEYEKYAEVGRIDYKIENNQIIDKDRDEVIDEVFELYKGFQFYPCEAKTIGLGYLRVADEIKILSEKEYKTIITGYKFIYNGGVVESFESKEIVGGKTQYKYASKVAKRLKDAEILVDKQNTVIKSLVKDFSEDKELVKNNFTEIKQDINNVLTTIQNVGGSNLIKNSVMFAGSDFWDFLDSENEQLIDFFNPVNAINTKYNFENDTLILEGNNEKYSYIYFDITELVKNNEGKSLWFNFETAVRENGAGIPVQIKIQYNDNTPTLYKSLTNVNLTEKYPYLIENIKNIKKIIFSVFANNSSTPLKSKITLTRPSLNFKKNATYQKYGISYVDYKSDVLTLGAGGVSGHSFTIKNKIVKQKLMVDINSTYTFSTKVKKDASATGYIKIYNDIEEYKLDFLEGESYFYSNFEINKIKPKLNYYYIEFFGYEITFTDNMFNLGGCKLVWEQSNSEVMTSNMQISSKGLKVYRNDLKDYTIMSPLEFSGYTSENGIETRVFTLNKDKTEMKKSKTELEIAMPPIKIVPKKEGDILGWGFVGEVENDTN